MVKCMRNALECQCQFADTRIHRELHTLDEVWIAARLRASIRFVVLNSD